ncbi:AMIN domain-containing protein [Nesterenkonia sp. AY15]|uniref:AMIN domain-containing protein n=1 Tax=Nesterenkonia sp. AY15 TaxID=2901139 RepID=UPI001F4D2444|nr:AMIN domain-containing protein [Nesterenkonia sp. AY15]MCH8570513.1 AMIN domain-containing protein [Nesterenkonia sp. AY15]
MRHPHRSQITALGAAMLLLLASCGSPEEGQDPAPAEDAASEQPTEDTEGAQDSEEPDPASESEDPGESEQPDESGASAAPEDEDQDQGDDAASADFSTDAQESDGFPGEFTRGEEPNHLVEIRSGVHEGYDRVVFEYSGDGTPSWRGEYTDAAAELGRGEPIEVAGEHILEINVNGPSWAPEDEPEDELPAQEYYERDRGGAFEEIFIQGPFEAHSQYLIGLDQERPFQMQLLEEPTRLVVDIANAE